MSATCLGICHVFMRQMKQKHHMHAAHLLWFLVVQSGCSLIAQTFSCVFLFNFFRDGIFVETVTLLWFGDEKHPKYCDVYFCFSDAQIYFPIGVLCLGVHLRSKWISLSDPLLVCNAFAKSTVSAASANDKRRTQKIVGADLLVQTSQPRQRKSLFPVFLASDPRRFFKRFFCSRLGFLLQIQPDLKPNARFAIKCHLHATHFLWIHITQSRCSLITCASTTFQLDAWPMPGRDVDALLNLRPSQACLRILPSHSKFLQRKDDMPSQRMFLNYMKENRMTKGLSKKQCRKETNKIWGESSRLKQECSIVLDTRGAESSLQLLKPLRRITRQISMVEAGWSSLLQDSLVCWVSVYHVWHNCERHVLDQTKTCLIFSHFNSKLWQLNTQKLHLIPQYFVAVKCFRQSVNEWTNPVVEKWVIHVFLFTEEGNPSVGLSGCAVHTGKVCWRFQRERSLGIQAYRMATKGTCFFSSLFWTILLN